MLGARRWQTDGSSGTLRKKRARASSVDGRVGIQAWRTLMSSHARLFSALPLCEQERLHASAARFSAHKERRICEDLEGAEDAFMLASQRSTAELAARGLVQNPGAHIFTDRGMSQLLDMFMPPSFICSRVLTLRAKAMAAPQQPSEAAIHGFQSMRTGSGSESMPHPLPWTERFAQNRDDLAGTVVTQSLPPGSPAFMRLFAKQAPNVSMLLRLSYTARAPQRSQHEQRREACSMGQVS